MYCGRCNEHVVKCECRDMDERLESVANNEHTSLCGQQNIERRKEYKESLNDDQEQSEES